MEEYINALQKVKVSKTCNNCLYCGSNGISCGNANNHGKAMVFVNYGNACQYFWLDQNRFPNAESRR
jgi:hypothetical protein